MRGYSEGAWERAMKIQEVILRAMAKRITWWRAAEIIGISDRSLRGGRDGTSVTDLTVCSIDGGGSLAPGACRWRRRKTCCGSTRRSTRV
jgi:hypothetical protein